tara:strand:+ start:605 stop:775 length:171 start_codon:yes stop_codon:yes gene_type:complete
MCCGDSPKGGWSLNPLDPTVFPRTSAYQIVLGGREKSCGAMVQRGPENDKMYPITE